MKKIIEKINLLVTNNKNKITIIGIDGPTSVGKTVLSDNIKKTLEKDNIPCTIFRLDWTLKDREERAKDVINNDSNKSSFDFEAELHMNLDICIDFLKKVRIFDQNKNENSSKIELINIYNRENNGKLDGRKEIILEKEMVIIIEGHYTLRNCINEFIDFNILMLGDVDELQKRKIERVKDYRTKDEAIDYLFRVDMPSFKNHLIRFGNNADITIDNTDYNSPIITTNFNIKNRWIENLEKDKRVLPKLSLKDSIKINELVFSNSNFISNEFRKEFEKVLFSLFELDNHIGNYLRISINSIKNDLSQMIDETIKSLNKNMHEDYVVDVMHTNSLYNVYYRRLPFSICFGLFEKKSKIPKVSFLADIFQSELSIQVIWDGGYKKLSIPRMLGEITNNKNYNIIDSSDEVSIKENQINIFLPTDFTFPKFLDKYEYKLIYIRKEEEVISPSTMIKRIFYEEGVWIQRFALYSELKFFKNIMSMIGINNIQIGNYLISIKSDNQELLNNFKNFSKEWKKPIIKESLFERSNNEMDNIIIEERNDLRKIVNKNCSTFSVLDGYLFSDFMYGDKEKIENGLNDIKFMLSSKNRLLRKRITQFILRNFPLISMPTNKLWNDLPTNSKKEIYLEVYNKLSPSIMSEIYLWLSVNKTNSAILGCNIYDIRPKSIDCISYLEASTKENMPIILQCSMNASGQKETDSEGRVYEGYLNISNGPEGFIESANSAARNLFLTKGIIPPLFGIGLDHVGAKYDFPKGRCRRFLDICADTGLLTHYVPDGEGLFDAKSKTMKSIVQVYNKMAEFSAYLTYDLRSYYLMDIEVCAGELNYSDKNEEARIQTIEEMNLFMNDYQKALENKGDISLLSRPMLFIGNLGTTHHGYDKSPPKVEMSQKWRDVLKCENFVSPVLHGTTNTHNSVLKKASFGCHKINIAGEFLNIMINNLPEDITRIVHESKIEPKRVISSIRHLMDNMKEEDVNNLNQALIKSCSDILTTINSPRLNSRDISYFHYSKYNYPSEHVEVIVGQINYLIEHYKMSTLDKKDNRSDNFNFCASMIEVPEEEMDKYVDVLWNNEIRHFHIDAGDGKFIPRKFSGIGKAMKIRKKYPTSKLNAHLMIENPHLPEDGRICPIEQYIKAGCDSIAIHPRSIKNKNELINALRLIKNLGATPGILIETSDNIEEGIIDIINEADIKWVVVMGVPIGYGGQIFQFSTLQTLSSLYEFSKINNKNILIEIDGGLTFQTVELCKNAGATLFSGWSIVKSNDLKKLEMNVKELNKLLKG